ncbi:MAE_28990/MAE_18760 family HEPN-like nuclease [Chryseobacterium lathyri]|uniref:MAE_28990/MAE_18760 family HEPN-like nuclease n=1 Tax=Chryseobacterium lathyri TaxID=395933 RepID=UPI001CBE2658|nr:MAE_28990/MAE_18760 family HEPN-like nuclease [Chryseobacterium lathyri]
MTIRDEFNNRVNEVNSFYEILAIVELESPKIIAYDLVESKDKVVNINSSKIDTLRSTAYLLLYNLIESTIYNTITTIFDEIKDSGLKYSDVIDDVQKYWLNNIYKHNDNKKKETIIETIINISNKISNEIVELASNEINYGGSLDAQKIFATAKSMKIDINNVHIIYDKTKHGESLVDVKKKRNWLAHGEKSFIEVGGSSTYSQLNDSKTHICDFLNEFIKSVENYILHKHFQIATV